MKQHRALSDYPKWQWWLLGIIIVGALVAAAVVPSRRGAPETAEPSVSTLEMRACDAAQRAVRAELRAPATATFPGCAMGADQYRIGFTDDRSQIYVFGHVDAENAFGAMIRTQFAVEMRNAGGEFIPTEVALGD